MKVKKYEEVEYITTSKKTIKEIKRDYKIMTIFMIILIIIAFILCLQAMSLSIKYEVLIREKAELERVNEMQKSMIADLEENCQNLYISNNYNNDDLNKIKSYIMGQDTLSDEEKTKYDVNRDGKISAVDYTMIKNRINNKEGK